LADLVDLRLVSVALQVDQLLDALFRENVMAASDPLGESEAEQAAAQVVELDARVSSAGKNSLNEPCVSVRKAPHD